MVREFKDYVPLDEALRILRDGTSVLPRLESVPSHESYGRYLAADVVAQTSIPDMDCSHMDGYAVRASELDKASEVAPVRLRVGEVTALGNLQHIGLP